MKRFSCILFLCAFLVLFVSSAWAKDLVVTLSADTSVKTSADKFIVKSGDAEWKIAKFKDLFGEKKSADTGDRLIFTAGFTYCVSSDDNIPISGMSLDIRVSGDGMATIDGQSADRETPFIKIEANGKTDANGTKISGLKFTNISMSIKAEKSGGGAIAVVSMDNVTISNCVFEGNALGSGQTAKQYTGGAAIFVKDAKGLKIESCDFENNHIAFGPINSENLDSTTTPYDGTAGVHEAGGSAIYILAASDDVSVTITSSDFLSNDFANQKTNGSGGAIASVVAQKNSRDYTGTPIGVSIDLKISDSTFKDNRAGRSGGAVYAVTDIDTVSNTGLNGSIDVTITNSEFTGNGLEGAANSGAVGGAVFGYAASGQIKLNIEDSTFTENFANGTISSETKSGTRGGAVAVETFKDGVVSASIKNVRFEGNRANWGGALSNWGTGGSVDLIVENATFYNNSLTESKDETNIKEGVTGVVYYVGSAVATRATANKHATTAPSKAFTTIINSTFYSNDAILGGAVATIASDDRIASVDIIHSTFVNNKAKGDGKAADIYAIINASGDSQIRVYDSILFNDGDYYAIGANQSKDNATISLDHVAVSKIVSPDTTVGALKSTDVLGAAKAFVMTTASFDTTPETAKVDNVEHTFFLLTTAGSPDLTAGGGKSDDLPVKVEKDLLKNDYAPKPSLGAVQYTPFDIEGVDGGTTLTAITFVKNSWDLSVTFNEASVDFTITSGDDSLEDTAIESLSIDVDTMKLSVTAKAAGTYNFTITATGSADTEYQYYKTSKQFTLTVTDAATTIAIKSEDLALETTVGTATSLDLSAVGLEVSSDYAAGTVAEIAADAYTAAWSTASTDTELKAVGLSFADNVLTVAEDATAGNYTIGLTVTVTLTANENITATETTTVTVSIDEGITEISLTATDSGDITVARGETITAITITAVSGDDPVWTISSDLPDGLSVTSEDDTATISGTVDKTATLGEYPVTITATNGKGSEEVKFNFTVTDAAVELSDSYTFTARKGIATDYVVTPATVGTGVTWKLGDTLPDGWTVAITASSDASATITATAPTSEKTNTQRTFKIIAENTAGEDSADVTVTVAGGIYNVNSDFTSGTYTFPATRVTDTNDAGQPTAKTTSVFRNAANEVMLSVDITITTESTDISCMSGDEITTPISVDVSLYVVDKNYTDYASEITVTIPGFLELSGDASIDSGALESGDKHYDYILSGTPTASGDYRILIEFDVSASGDIPVLKATDSSDIMLKVGAEVVPGNRDSHTGSDGIAYDAPEETTTDSGQPALLVKSAYGGNVGEAISTFTQEDFDNNVIMVGSGLTTFGNMLNYAIRSLDLTKATDLQEGTLDLNGNQSVKSVTMGSGTGGIAAVTLTGSAVEVFDAKGSTNLKTLTVAGSNVKDLDVSDTGLSDLNAAGCTSLTNLVAEECMSLTTLNVSGCSNLTNLQAKGTNTRSQGIKEVNLTGCTALQHIGLRDNRILWQNLSAFGNLVDADFSGQNEFLEYTMGRMSFGSLFSRRTSMASVEGADEVEGADGEEADFSKVTEISAWDEDGNPIEVTYNSETGEVMFASAPYTFSYTYETDARVDGSNVDVTVDGNGKVETGDGPGDASSGCDAGFGGMFATAVVLAALISKKR